MSILTKEEVEAILTQYKLGRYEHHTKHWWSLENEVYELQTNKGRYILKIVKDDNKGYLLWNIMSTEKLRKRGIPTPQTYKTKKGNYLPLHKGKRILLQKYITGNELKRATPQFITEFAHNLGRLDKALLSFGIQKKYLWKKFGHQFEPAWYRSSSKIEGFDFDKEDNEIVQELNKNVDKKKLRKSSIHADYQLNNLKVKKGKIQAILDFGDMHEDYLAFEVAIALNHLFFIEQKANKKYLSLFFHEYERYVPLNQEEKKAIYYFIKIRMLAGIVWCDLHRKKHPEKAKKLTQWLKGTINHYQEFNKVSLEEFLALTKK